MGKMRNLVIVLGDQLDQTSSAFDDFQLDKDLVWMAEVYEESEYVWSHKARIALFLSAMRHFKNELETKGYPVHYDKLDSSQASNSLQEGLRTAIKKYNPHKVIVTEPGEWRVKESITNVCKDLDIELEIRQDRHFICSMDDFASHVNSRKQLRLEFFYRELRKRENILMDGEHPAGDKWNFDRDNRNMFDKNGPGTIAAPLHCPPDSISKDVFQLVLKKFPNHPGSLDNFSYPINRKQAKKALHDFINTRLRYFGTYQDAMWTNEPFLYHSRLSSCLNVKLLQPREVIEAAEKAYRKGKVPLSCVEGFIRQVLGWREYVRGVYWYFMPQYRKRNFLNATLDLPNFYWTGETDMTCLYDTIQQTLRYGYAHHIQRLMVTGLFALLVGVHPTQVHQWYLAIYADAIEWVEMPNTLGMSQYADGGIMASKPYVASGKYIQRMSNYCDHCRYNPKTYEGDDACPFTVLYWDFLMKHRKILSNNNRMRFQLINVDKLDQNVQKKIRKKADQIRGLYT